MVELPLREWHRKRLGKKSCDVLGEESCTNRDMGTLTAPLCGMVTATTLFRGVVSTAGLAIALGR